MLNTNVAFMFHYLFQNSHPFFRSSALASRSSSPFFLPPLPSLPKTPMSSITHIPHLASITADFPSHFPFPAPHPHPLFYLPQRRGQNTNSRPSWLVFCHLPTFQDCDIRAIRRSMVVGGLVRWRASFGRGCRWLCLCLGLGLDFWVWV